VSVGSVDMAAPGGVSRTFCWSGQRWLDQR
jgi:hypothetical protein